MEYIVIILLIILSLSLSIIIFNKNREISNIEYFISRITEHSSQTLLKSSTESVSLQKMIIGINRLIEKQNKIQNEYENNILQYKEILESIAHDFKTPATSILGYIELLGEIENKEEQDKYLNIVKTRTKELNGLIDDFFVLSVLNTKRYPYNLEEINIADILTEQLLMYYEELDEKFEDIDVKLGSMGFKTISDKKAIIRIFNNIIKNAFSHGKGYFKIYISKEKEYKISFENYIDKNAKRRTGIGMRIIKKFCKDLNIHISIENTKNIYKINLLFNGDDRYE